MATLFISDLFFRNPPKDTNFKDIPQTSSRTLVRGLLIEKNNPDVSKALTFQFNPTTMGDSKAMEYFERKRTGYATPDSVWISGSAATLKFELFLDATADSNSKYFGKKADYGSDMYTSLSDVDGNNLLEYGTLPQVERLKSFFYPQTVTTGTRFVNDNSVAQNNSSRTSDQFLPPPVLIFVYGPLYLEVKLTSLDISHELFNRKLAPIRSKAQVVLTVREDITVNTSVPILKQAGSSLYGPTSIPTF